MKDLILETGISQHKTIKLMMTFKSKWGIDIAQTEFRTNIQGSYENHQQIKPRTGREKNCNVCEKLLLCGYTLTHHMRKHTGEVF